MLSRQTLSSLFYIVIPIFCFVSGYTLADTPAASPLSLYGSGISLSELTEVQKIVEQKFFTHHPIDTKKVEQNMIEWFITGLGDPHTVFFPPKETTDFTTQVSGEFSGIGAELSTENDTVSIVAPIKDSPSDKAGIQPRDQILQVNDWVVPAKADVATVVDKIRGPKGSTVTLKLFRPSTKEILDKNIIRDTIQVQSVKTTYEKDIAIVRLSQFSLNTEELFRATVTEIVQKHNAGTVRGIILDLRNNPWGVMEGAINIAGEFIGTGKTIVARRDKTGTTPFASPGPARLEHIPTVVLINGGSASAAEILAGALTQDNKSPLIGDTSYGKGSVQELVPFADGSSLKVTIADWLLPNGANITGSGITPTVPTVFDIPAWTEHKRDTQLEQAQKVLREQLKQSE